MSNRYRSILDGFFFWDTDGSGANPIAPYQVVSLATKTEVDAAKAAGFVPASVGYGDVMVRTPVAAGIATRRILGVTNAGGFSLGLPSADLIPVVIDGVAAVQMSAATSFDPNAMLTAGLVETRTSAQTPFTNNFDMLLPFDPRVSLTYQLCLAAALTIAPASGATANVLYFPLGWELEDGSAKYDISRVELTGISKEIYA